MNHLLGLSPALCTAGRVSVCLSASLSPCIIISYVLHISKSYKKF